MTFLLLESSHSVRITNVGVARGSVCSHKQAFLCARDQPLLCQKHNMASSGLRKMFIYLTVSKMLGILVLVCPSFVYQQMVDNK